MNRIDRPGTAEEAWDSWVELGHLPVADPAAWASAVIVAAHPDDEVLGVGGTTAILAAAGARLRLVAVTDGEASHSGADPAGIARARTTESAAALAMLGARDIEVIRLRIARLAGFSAGLGLFLYGTLAVAVIGAAGAQIDATWTVSANVDDRLGNNTVFYLWVLPLVTAALEWAAAAVTARIRPRLAVSVAAVPFTIPSSVGKGNPGPKMTLPHEGDKRITGEAGAGPRISCCSAPSWRQPCPGWPSACSVANLPRAHRALLQHCL